MDRPLIRAASTIDWDAFEREFGPLYHESQGRPGLPIRLMVGLTYLDRMYDLSDEAVVERWLDNPYRQHVCGFEHFQHDFPLNPGSLVRWRKHRAAIEPVIGHLKSDHRMLRNMLKGKEGDNINAMLAGCGFNLRKLVRILLRPLWKSLFQLFSQQKATICLRLDEHPLIRTA